MHAKKSNYIREVAWLCAFCCIASCQTLGGSAGSMVMPIVERTIFELGKHFLLYEDPAFAAIGTASAGAVVIDTSHSRQKGWYAEELMYDHQTMISGFQNAPVTTNLGQPSVDHRYYPAKFKYYDMTVYERDPQSNEFVVSHTWVNSGWYEPDVYLNDERFYVIWATTKSSDTKYRVFSNYQMQNGPDDRLRKPGTYTVRVKYKVFTLSYQEDQGLVFTPNQTTFFRDTRNINAVADDHQHVDFLRDHQWVMEGPTAFGWIKRSWEKQYNVLVSTNLFDSLPMPIPPGTSNIKVKVVNQVREDIGSLNE